MSKAVSIGLPDLIRGLETVYLLIWLGLGILAVWLPKNWKLKLGATLLVVIAGAILPVYLYLQVKQEVAKQKPIVERRNAQLEAAMARFEERCKTAGEKVTRTVDDVEGILLMKIRPAKGNDADPMWPGAAMVSERTQDEFIESFLFYEYRGKGFEHQRGNVTNTPTQWPGYQYVDVVDETDGQRYRYTAPMQPRNENYPGDIIQKLTRQRTTKTMPLYGVSYEDIVDPEDRKHWIAGTVIRVIDLKSKETIAEQVRFVFDTGQGSISGGRSPWVWANYYGKRCPVTSGNLKSQTRWFVDQVLKPKKGG